MDGLEHLSHTLGFDITARLRGGPLQVFPAGARARLSSFIIKGLGIFHALAVFASESEATQGSATLADVALPWVASLRSR